MACSCPDVEMIRYLLKCISGCPHCENCAKLAKQYLDDVLAELQDIDNKEEKTS